MSTPPTNPGSVSRAPVASDKFLDRLNRIDRRWIFLAMSLCVAGPIIWVGVTGKTFPEAPTAQSKGAFDVIQNLPPKSKVLISFDFDPASAGELQPMATAFINHCASKGHLIYCMTLWAPGTPLINATKMAVLDAYYPGQYKYGENFIDLGYQAGNEVVIKLLSTSIEKAYPKDSKDRPLSHYPMMQGITKVGDFDAVVSVSAGDPGAKQWVQYAISETLTTSKPLPFVAGSTGVQTPQLIPYYPQQMKGVLGAIKGAAEYEFLVNRAVAEADGGKPTPAPLLDAQRRMAPQLTAHVLMVLLIIVGNVIFFSQRRGPRA